MAEPSASESPAIEERTAIPAGFLAGGATAGIKPSGNPDLAVIAVAGGGRASAAATFTTNLVQAAPVRISREHLRTSGGTRDAAGFARGVVITSGCANAATGPAGDADQVAIADAFAARLGCGVDETLLASTGLIGTRLPVDLVRGALERLVPAALTPDDAGLEAAARAIMTTDSRRKAATATADLPAGDGSLRSVRVTGIAKGVGMIHPRMATLISVVLTDAAVEPTTLLALLRDAVAATFNQTSVDGDTSTNDTVFLLASGAAGASQVEAGSAAAAHLARALTAVCRSLARQQAIDGEGATTLITCRVTHAADLIDARAISRAVVSSSLLKAAVHGRDPNWGRLLSAAGTARRDDGRAVALDPDALTVSLCGTRVFDGSPVTFDAAAVSRAMDAPEVLIEIDVGAGDATADAWGCDLTEEYVIENSAYST